MMNNQRECGRNSAGMRRVHGRADYIAEADGAAQMDNFEHLPQENFDTEEMRGSMQAILADNIGNYVVIEFLMGTEDMIRKQGMLYFVGRSFLTLYDERSNNFIVCDIFSVRFVYFYMPGDRPRLNYNTLPPVSGEPGMGMASPNRRR